MTRFLDAGEAGEARGAVVVVDVLRAFSTAAYSFAAGATAIWLVDSVDQALTLKAAHPELLAMGEDGGRRIVGFDFANSPWEVSQADLAGRELVQRTSAGTRGVVAATGAERRWCASLVCATATANAVTAAGLGEPTYVITGRRSADQRGEDDLLTAQLIERVRVGAPVEADATARAVATSREAAVTLALGRSHVDPRDVELAVRVDAFAFAMEARVVSDGLLLTPHVPTEDGRPPQRST
ncbi:2-phosphosulfolactate phosphatase [uncultured Jatrophihabitans sp.]|uniref:2-phosphosulfolactate phosphatase n=1 Tax=uncultured Jatrophihabitans sp. TaxID=1610747 RepID=UPI0035CBA5B5